ncbi:MAG: hypothetical protein ACJAX3_002422 [Patiriisocius sp.]|jgi:hypothetical protein
MIGQNIYSSSNGTIHNATTTIALPALNPGTYILKINNNSKNISSIKKLIIK